MTICSLVVQAQPRDLEAVDRTLSAMRGIEIHAKDENGKMVVVIDDPSREYCSKAMTEMAQIDGVLSTSLIYEYQEDLDLEAENSVQDEPDQIELPAFNGDS